MKVNLSGSDKKKKVVDAVNAAAKLYNEKVGLGTLDVARNFPIPDVISTGIPEIDNQVLSIGGLPVGRCIEIAGETSAGKSTLALNFCREAIKVGRKVAIAENEGTFTYEYAQKIGLDPDSYYLFRGSELDGREYLDGILGLIEAGFDFIVLDSIQGIIDPKATEAGMSGASMYTRSSTAQMMADFFRILKGGWESKFHKKGDARRIVKMIDNNPILIFINHLKPIFGDSGGFGPPKKESGGSEDLKFLYTFRLWLEHFGFSKDRDENGNPYLTKVRLTCEKNKLAPRGRSAIMYIDNRTGQFLSDTDAIVKAALRRGIIEKSGSWYNMVEPLPEDFVDDCHAICEDSSLRENKWQGKEAFAKFCRTNKQLLSYILRFE